MWTFDGEGELFPLFQEPVAGHAKDSWWVRALETRLDYHRELRLFCSTDRRRSLAMAILDFYRKDIEVESEKICHGMCDSIRAWRRQGYPEAIAKIESLSDSSSELAKINGLVLLASPELLWTSMRGDQGYLTSQYDAKFRKGDFTGWWPFIRRQVNFS